MIHQMVELSNQKALVAGWSHQKQRHQSWQKAKTLNKLEIGMGIDVRDRHYIWCAATIKLIIESPLREPLLVVTYLETHEKNPEEIIQRNSARIAASGTYTSRDDLPKYCKK